MAASSQHRCVFVGNIPYDATEEQLIQICEEVGPVVSFRLVLDRETGKPKGYGFCEYKDEETALSARRNLQGYEINGRQLRVDFAENDKNSDRSREQGRGGPGLTSNADVQKSLGSTSVLGDSALHQPVGLQLAATAASVMAGALGGAQTASLLSIQNGIQNQSVSGLGNDPLTQYLAKMSRHQLNEIMSEMKALATQNKALARQLLQGSAQLPKALFQAQIMLGMVSPQMLQVANIRQTSGSVQKPSFQDGMQDQKPILPSHPGQTPLQKEAPVGMISRASQIPLSNVTQNLSVPQQSALPLQHAPIQLQVQQQLPSQDQVPVAGTLAGLPGVPKIPTLRSQPLGGSFQLQNPALPSSQGLMPQIQPPLLQHPRPVGNATHPQIASSDAVLQQTVPTRPLTPQFAPEVESALWQQVMSLTPEQLSSLPKEQQEQVLQIQKALQQQMTSLNPSS